MPNGDAAIRSVAPRSSLLERPNRTGTLKPVAANLTQLVIVAAIEPGIQTHLIDSYCVAAERAGIQPTIAINKADLHKDERLEEIEQLIEIYRNIGMHCVLCKSKETDGVDALAHLLANNTSALVGQSGVGKSSIVNALLPRESVRTGALSQASGQGSHTTSTTTLYNLPSGGELIDSPGVREFTPHVPDSSELAHAFREFYEYARQCRFANCLHLNEPGCAVKIAVESHLIAPSRYASYLDMLNPER